MTLPTEIPYPPEVAAVVVENYVFLDWESVWVEHRYREAWPIFKFTAAEHFPPSTLPLVQFHPGQFVQIYLAQQLAINGYIVRRQTAYDANSHGVQLEGYGITWLAARASHVTPDDGNFDNMGFLEIAARVLAPWGGKPGFKTEGEINDEPFLHEQISPGEPIWDFLERLARKRGITMGSDEKGDFIFRGHMDAVPVVEQLVEGVNILKCQATLDASELRSEWDVRGQTPGGSSSGAMGGEASQVDGYAKGDLPHYSPLLTPAEDPLKGKPEADERAHWDHVWGDYTYMKATITLQGWLRSDGSLWRAGSTVHVNSPMALLYGVDMAIERVVFSQDSHSGTLTTLDLVDPRIMDTSSEWNTNNPDVPNSTQPDTSRPAPAAEPGATPPAPPPATIDLFPPFGGT
jgi:prophage tail gpP-like protein